MNLHLFLHVVHGIYQELASFVELKKLYCIDVDYYINQRNNLELSVLSLVSCSCWVNYFVNKYDPLLS